jgi:hypothetical protein
VQLSKDEMKIKGQKRTRKKLSQEDEKEKTFDPERLLKKRSLLLNIYFFQSFACRKD